MRSKEGIEGLIKAQGLPEKKHSTAIEWSRIQKKAGFLRTALAYTKTSPNEEFLRKELQRLYLKEAYAEEGYNHWLETDYDLAYHGKAPKTAFNKYLGIPKMVKQIKMLQFLLQDDGDEFNM